MQVEKVGSRWAGWDINWCKPWVVNESILGPTYVVISSKHQDLDCALPKMLILADLHGLTVFQN